MKVFKALSFFIILGAFHFSRFSDAKRVITYPSITCSGSNKTAVITECYSRLVAKETHGFNLLAYDFSMKIGNNFQTLISGSDIDICEILSGKQSNAVRYGLNIIRKSIPKRSLRPCPLSGHHDLVNITAGRLDSKASNIPEATYLCSLRFFNDDDQNVASLKIVAESKDVQD
ncbi:CLUMA_CG002479, isoform A [Clunio marinus]|uniref:CLUMA_CG002479, isoform A n=1 Tax=Clunio marinus TaxID=568069 RepID=A0A1J1HMG6_9DIPT|nr:CLUMA_CG002479, isoform A [Clunio marinus]